MLYRFPMCSLLVVISSTFAFLLRHSVVEAGPYQENAWVEPHDVKWKKRVAQNQRFLTRNGRESLRNELEVRNRELEEEEYTTTNPNQIRGQQKSQNEERRRDLQAPNSTVPSLNVLVCLVQWTNHPDRNKAVSVEDYKKLFNGAGRDADLYPGGSVKEYFEAMSYGEFTINFEVTDWVMTDYTEQQFTADGSQGRTQELQAAFEPVLEYLDNEFFDFKPFDSDFDRRLDLTVFLHSGYDGTSGGTDCETGKTAQQRVASHARTGADLSTWRSSSQIKLGAYVVASAFRETCDTEIGRIGTIVHELIHPFGLPDLYDMEAGYGTGNIGGIDRFGVMANPSGNAGGDLSWPGHVSAWTRTQLGWIDPTVIDSDGTYELRAVEQHSDMFKITKGFADKEYLLLENRQAINGDFDERFFSPGGILIYHVDENIWDIFDNGGNTGNFLRGGPFLDGWPGNGKHYPIALLQADGLYELEQGISGGGSTDIWKDASQVLGPGNGEKVASKANYPNTDSYAFGVIKETGITVRNFSTKTGTTTTFEVCGLSGACSDNSETKPTPPQESPTDDGKELENEPPVVDSPPLVSAAPVPQSRNGPGIFLTMLVLMGGFVIASPV